MIEEEFSSENQLAESRVSENSKLLINLAKTIYAMEASIAGQSNQKKIEEIRARIDAKAEDFIV